MVDSRAPARRDRLDVPRFALRNWMPLEGQLMLGVRGDVGRKTPPRSARCALPLALTVLLLGSCSSGLNPSFLELLGISPINSLGPQPGSVVVAVINRTAFPAELRLQMLEAEGFVNVSELNAPGNDLFISATDCEITQITFVSLTLTTIDDTGAQAEVEADVRENPLIGGRHFTCGNVIAITVTGANEPFEMSIQVL